MNKQTIFYHFLIFRIFILLKRYYCLTLGWLAYPQKEFFNKFTKIMLIWLDNYVRIVSTLCVEEFLHLQQASQIMDEVGNELEFAKDRLKLNIRFSTMSFNAAFVSSLLLHAHEMKLKHISCFVFIARPLLILRKWQVIALSKDTFKCLCNSRLHLQCGASAIINLCYTYIYCM